MQSLSVVTQNSSRMSVPILTPSPGGVHLEHAIAALVAMAPTLSDGPTSGEWHPVGRPTRQIRARIAITATQKLSSEEAAYASGAGPSWSSLAVPTPPDAMQVEVPTRSAHQRQTPLTSPDSGELGRAFVSGRPAGHCDASPRRAEHATAAEQRHAAQVARLTLVSNIEAGRARRAGNGKRASEILLAEVGSCSSAWAIRIPFVDRRR